MNDETNVSPSVQLELQSFITIFMQVKKKNYKYNYTNKIKVSDILYFFRFFYISIFHKCIYKYIYKFHDVLIISLIYNILTSYTALF